MKRVERVRLLATALGMMLAASNAAGRAGGRGANPAAIPNATPAQTAALTQWNQDLAELTRALATARTEVVAAALAWPRNDAAVAEKVRAIQAAELALADARTRNLAKIQASENKLSPPQLLALAANLGTAPNAGRAGGGGGGGGVGGGVPNMNSNQVAALTQLTGQVQKGNATLAAARANVTSAALADPPDPAALQSKIAAVAAAEMALAKARMDALEKIQTANGGKDAFSPEQLKAIADRGGVIVSGAFNEPLPLAFDDHEGYVALFDGATLKGWDGNPKFWRVENGAIIGESTPQNPSGNTYLAYRAIEAHDFTIKLEIKVEGAGGSGIQYRSKTGIPWLTAVPANVQANAGPTNLDWMMTGPQADFWPSRDTTAQYSGQFYSENTPMRIMAWRGQVVEGAGMGPRRLMGNIGDRLALGKIVKPNDWNQYTVIARGGTFIHIVNGQLMSVLIDDDPTSSNNQSGLIGIEIEAVTKVSVRNVWLKKMN